MGNASVQIVLKNQGFFLPPPVAQSIIVGNLVVFQAFLQRGC
jgi:hypothetical protein